MILGINQNIPFKGKTYHIQTEDGGLKNPSVTTVLFIGGTTLASKKTSYADIVKSAQLEVVIKDIMKEQHKSMLLDLKNGRIEKLNKKKASQAAPAPAATPPAVAAPAPAATPPAVAAPVPQPSAPAATKPVPAATETKAKPNEDAVDAFILDHLSLGNDKDKDSK
jgi:type II secretory pathway component HofQ